MRGISTKVCGTAAVAALLLTAPVSGQERERCECPRIWVGGGLPEAGLLRMALGGGARLGIELDMEAGDASRGAVVRRVLPGAPAEEAGLEEGDEITAVNGTSLLSALPEDEPNVRPEESAAARRLVSLMAGVEPGDTVRLEVLRNGQRRDVAVVARRGVFLGDTNGFRMLEGNLPSGLLRRRELPMIQVAPRTGGFFTRYGLLGARLAELNPQLGEYFGVERGVLVLEVDDDAAVPLRAGDVIVAVDGRAVRDEAHLRDILRSYREDETLRLEVIRKGSRTAVEGHLGS